MHKSLMAAALATATICAIPASATMLPLDGGWQDDQQNSLGVITANSPWTFTIAGPATLSVVDCCISGDTYTISGDVSGVTTFYAGSTSDIQATGSYGSYWPDANYSKIAIAVGAGSYTFLIIGDGFSGVPAGLGVRLDSAIATVPEPLSWALLAAGLGVVGASLRGRRFEVRYA